MKDKRPSKLNRRLLCLTTGASITSPAFIRAQEARLRLPVGPFQPTPSDTRQPFEPFFKHVADRLGRPYDLMVTNDRAGLIPSCSR
jgi:phosphonate transport system substrate-binding protein